MFFFFFFPRLLPWQIQGSVPQVNIKVEGRTCRGQSGRHLCSSFFLLGGDNVAFFVCVFQFL